ncbi:MAG: hypothetical protein HDT26_05745 [Subdoligranulum sp.]|nr:hypothetical protein [Subdoligranulum sp.]
MKYEKKRAPKVIWEMETGDVTISAIEHGYRFGKCGLRLTRYQHGKITQNYASYIPVERLRELLDRLNQDITPKQLLLSFRDFVPAQVCRESNIGKRGEELHKTFLIAASDGGNAILQSTVQWGNGKPHMLQAEISQDDLYTMAATMEHSYRAYQLRKGAPIPRRANRSAAKGVDVHAA